MISLELLNQQALFRDLPLPLLQEIAGHVRMQEFGKREFVIHKGGPGDSLLMLFTGRLQVISLSDEGKEVGINFIEPGDYFGEIALIDGGQRSASVVSVTTSMVGFLPKQQALWLFQNNPVIAERVQKRLCETIRKEIQHRSTQGGAKAYTRIYAVLFGNRTLAAPKPGQQPVAIENLPNQQSIASMANVSRETVSRAIHALIKSGVIQKDTRRIIIKNPALIERLARGELTISEIPSAPTNPRNLATDNARSLADQENKPILVRRTSVVSD
jgi:CRP/FNR family cyclic AMP-dependent transcriptional regulator